MSLSDTSPRGGTHAIVIGAGIAGLAAARVLLNHFDRVTLLDRDRLPDGPSLRKGVPQARQFHVLLTAGSRILEDLFPGIDADLAEAGAPLVDYGWDSLVVMPQGQMPRMRTGLLVRSASRALREWTIRRRLLMNPRVRAQGGCEVVGLLRDLNGVSGVRLRPRGEEGPADAPLPETLRADLVVDASGRDSRSTEWLKDLGYGAVEESCVTPFMSYSTRLYRLASPPEWKLVGAAASAPDHRRGGGLAAIEDDLWMVFLVGTEKTYPPTTDPEFIAWTRALRSPIIYNALQGAEPVTPAYGYRRTENRFRHFERMRRWPERFVALGDAVACFNPVYGQGMTVGVESAVALDAAMRDRRARSLGGDLAGLAPAFQRRLARFLYGPWMMATGEDFRWPSTEGERPHRLVRLLQRYADRLLEVAAHDAPTYQIVLEVQHGVRLAPALFHPAVAAKVARSLVRRREASAT